MSPIKIAAIAFILGVVLLISIVAIPFSFEKQTPAKESLEAPAKKQTENSFKNPLTWLKENIQTGQNKSISTGILENPAESLSKIIGGVKPPFQQTYSSLTSSTQKQPTAKEVDDYIFAVLDVWKKNGFTEEEFNLIKKDKDNRPLPLEELMKSAISGTSLDGLKSSFADWQSLNERALGDFKKISPNSSILSSFHQKLIAWHEYYGQTAKNLNVGGLSKEEINNISNEFEQKAKTNAPNFQQVLILRLSERPSYNFFGLISPAYAQEETLTCDFGGPIRSYGDQCTNGRIYVITPPPGKNFCGALWAYDIQFAANPYLYGLFEPGACVLGKAIRVPGWCNKATANYAVGSATLWYFGSAPVLEECAIE